MVLPAHEIYRGKGGFAQKNYANLTMWSSCVIMPQKEVTKMNIKKFLAASLAITAVFGGTLCNYSSAHEYLTAYAFSSWEDNYKEVKSGDFEFLINIKSKKAMLTQYDGNDKNVVIPNSVDDYPVKEIMAGTFAGNETIESVVIPSNVWEIAGFANCTSLKSVTIENDPKHQEGVIRPSAFESCTALESITIPDCFSTVMENAFADCTSLAEINFPEHRMYVNKYTFNDTPWYKTLKADKDGFIRFQGVLIDAVGIKGEVVIPDDVAEIASFAFYKNCDITSVVIPENVTSIGQGAFYGCANMKTVTIKNPKCNISVPKTTFADSTVDIPRALWGDMAIDLGYEEGTPEYDAYVSSLEAANRDFTQKNKSIGIRGQFTPLGSYTGKIIGYKGSTAEKCAAKLSAEFVYIKTRGDVNSDGMIDSVDASNILKLYTKLSTSSEKPTEEELELYDMNKDSIIDAVDASNALAYYASKATGTD